MHLPQNTNGPPETPLDVDATRTYDRAYLINKLNYIHFIGGSVRAVFVHEKLGFRRELTMEPQPCAGTELTCRHVSGTPVELDEFRFAYLLVEDDSATLLVHARLHKCRNEVMVVELPDNCHPLLRLPFQRQINPFLNVEVFQKGARYTGRLLAFANGRLDIALSFDPPQTRHWLDPQAPVYLVLMEGREPCFTGNCSVESRRSADNVTICRFKTEERPFHRYRPKKYRSRRVNLRPAPHVVFTHPLTMQPVSCKLRNLSGMGFSFIGDDKATVLFTGLILTGVRLELAGEPIATCKAQVVYRIPAPAEEQDAAFHYGIAILHIDIADHTRLQRVIQQAVDPNAHVNGRVTQQALWAFFFETGFLYPQKYMALEGLKTSIQKTYEKLYMDQPSFARHFIYQKHGTILGHMAMLRFYDKAWLIHHHAARSEEDNGAGLRVLEQIGQFINESHALEAICMEYIFFFYRPENRFPSLLFGKAAEFVDDKGICSLDEFAYGHFRSDPNAIEEISAPWVLSTAEDKDLDVFRNFYEQKSDGLMARAFGLTPAGRHIHDLVEEYRRLGFQRKREIVSMKRGSRLHALFEINHSDIGLNMSDLTNCIRVFIIDREGIDKATFAAALNRLCKSYAVNDVPILAFPAGARDLLPVSIERRYMLWVLNLNHTDRYFSFMNRIVRFSRGRKRGPDGNSESGHPPGGFRPRQHRSGV